MKLLTFFIGLNLTAGAMEVNPDLAVPRSPSKEKTSNALRSPTTFDLISNKTPTLNVLFSDTPVKISKLEVKYVSRFLSAFTPLNRASVSVYRLLNHFISHCPFFNNFEGVYV